MSYPIQNTQLKSLIYYKLSVTEIPCILIKPFNAYIKTLHLFALLIFVDQNLRWITALETIFAVLLS